MHQAPSSTVQALADHGVHSALVCCCVQIGYCGLDKQSLGVGPEGGSLDISSYCAGYVSRDFAMMLLQARTVPCMACAAVPCMHQFL